MIYLIPVILACAGIFMNNKFTPLARKVYWGVILIFVILLIGLRYRVGVDTLGYMIHFKDTPSIHEIFNIKIFKNKHEPGYLLVCAVCRLFSKEFWPVQLVMATITNSCIFVFLYRYCKNVFTGLLIFFILQWLYFSTEIMRESAAIGIFLLNFKNLEEKKWINYYLLSLLSLSFHYSAIIIWFFPFVRFLKLNLFFYLACGAILAITPLVENLNEFLSLGVISEKVNTYIDEAEKNNFNWKIMNLAKTSFPAILTVILYRFSHKKNKYQAFVLLQIILSCGAFAIPQIFQRFSNYTTVLVTMSLANIITLSNLKTIMKVAVIVLVCLSQSVYYYSMIPAWFPYVSIFNPKVIKEREAFFRKIF